MSPGAQGCELAVLERAMDGTPTPVPWVLKIVRAEAGSQGSELRTAQVESGQVKTGVALRDENK